MPDPLSAAVSAFMVGAAEELGHECIRRHADDIHQALNATKKAVDSAIDEGWERDREAGGLSSWGEETPGTEMA